MLAPCASAPSAPYTERQANCLGVVRRSSVLASPLAGCAARRRHTEGTARSAGSAVLAEPPLTRSPAGAIRAGLFIQHELQMKRSFSASSGSSVQAGTSLGVLSDIQELNNEGQGTMNTNANMATPGGPP